MDTVTALPTTLRRPPAPRHALLAPLLTLARRRFQLAARTPRELVVQLLTPLLFAIAMYGAAETLAARVSGQEEYIGRVPAIAIVPWFLAGSLFPITALPVGLAWITRFLPLTHGLALLRYGLLGDSSGLHDIWGISSPAEMAAASHGILALFALVLSVVSVRVFSRAALR